MGQAKVADFKDELGLALIYQWVLIKKMLNSPQTDIMGYGGVQGSYVKREPQVWWLPGAIPEYL